MEIPEPKIEKRLSKIEKVYDVRSFTKSMGIYLCCDLVVGYILCLDFKEFLSVEGKIYSPSYFSCFGSKRNEFAAIVFMYMASTTIFFFACHYLFPQVFPRIRSVEVLVRREITFNCNILGVLYTISHIFLFSHSIEKSLLENFDKGLTVYDLFYPIIWLFFLYGLVTFQDAFVVSDTLNMEDDIKGDDIIAEENVDNNMYEYVVNYEDEEQYDDDDEDDEDDEDEENDLRWIVSIPYQHLWNGPTKTSTTICVDAMSHLSGYITVGEQETNTHHHED